MKKVLRLVNSEFIPEDKFLLSFIGKEFNRFELFSVRNPITDYLYGFLGLDTETMVIRCVFEKDSDSFSSEFKYQLFEKLMNELLDIP